MGYFNELDLNGDGGLNLTEVKEWIRPEGSNPIDAEVQHMMRKMDLDEGIRSPKVVFESEINQLIRFTNSVRISILENRI